MEASVWDPEPIWSSTTGKRTFSPNVFHSDPRTKRRCVEPHGLAIYENLTTPVSSQSPWPYQYQSLICSQPPHANIPPSGGSEYITDTTAFPQAPAFLDSLYPTLIPSSNYTSVPNEGSQDLTGLQSTVIWPDDLGLALTGPLNNELDIGCQLQEASTYITESEWPYDNPYRFNPSPYTGEGALSTWDFNTTSGFSPSIDFTNLPLRIEEQRESEGFQSGTPSLTIESTPESAVLAGDTIPQPAVAEDIDVHHDSCFGVVRNVICIQIVA